MVQQCTCVLFIFYEMGCLESHWDDQFNYSNCKERGSRVGGEVKSKNKQRHKCTVRLSTPPYSNLRMIT